MEKRAPTPSLVVAVLRFCWKSSREVPFVIDEVIDTNAD
jgi:hypothetical protein